MNKQFHQLAPLLALTRMPAQFTSFMLSDGYNTDQLSIDADLPDLLDHDNITQNAEIHHAHSFKMEEVDGKLNWLDGDVLDRLKGLCADAHDFKAENKLNLVKYSLAKATHYKVDSMTYPHLHRGKPWSIYHADFETYMGKFITEHATEIGNMTFEPYRDIYHDSRKISEIFWYDSSQVLTVLENRLQLPDAVSLALCQKIVKSIGDLWTTIALELRII